MALRLPVARTLIHAFKVVFLVGLFALLWWAVDWQASMALLAAADPRWLVAAALALTVQTVLSALRWRITAARLGITLSVREALREYYLSQLVNQSLPGGVLGDAGRAVRARGQAGLLASGQAVVFERVAGQIGLLALLALGLIAGALLGPVLTWPVWLIVPVVGALVILGCLALAIGTAMRWMAMRETSLHRGVRAFAHAVLARDVRLRQATLSLATALCNVAAFGFCALSLGVDLPLLSLIAIVPLILFAMVLPLSISGWGLREGAAAALFPIVGATTSEGLATSIAFGLVFLATVLPGMVATWLRPNAHGQSGQSATID